MDISWQQRRKSGSWKKNKNNSAQNINRIKSDVERIENGFALDVARFSYFISFYFVVVDVFFSLCWIHSLSFSIYYNSWLLLLSMFASFISWLFSVLDFIFALQRRKCFWMEISRVCMSLGIVCRCSISCALFSLFLLAWFHLNRFCTSVWLASVGACVSIFWICVEIFTATATMAVVRWDDNILLSCVRALFNFMSGIEKVSRENTHSCVFAWAQPVWVCVYTFAPMRVMACACNNSWL